MLYRAELMRKRLWSPFPEGYLDYWFPWIEWAYITFAYFNQALLFSAHFTVMSPANQCQCNCSYGAATVELSIIEMLQTLTMQRRFACYSTSDFFHLCQWDCTVTSSSMMTQSPSCKSTNLFPCDRWSTCNMTESATSTTRGPKWPATLLCKQNEAFLVAVSMLHSLTAMLIGPPASEGKPLPRDFPLPFLFYNW